MLNICADISSRIPQWWRTHDVWSNLLEVCTHVSTFGQIKTYPNIAALLIELQHALADFLASEQPPLGMHWSLKWSRKGDLNKACLTIKLAIKLWLMVVQNSRGRTKRYSRKKYRMKIGRWNVRTVLDCKESGNLNSYDSKGVQILIKHHSLKLGWMARTSW